MKYNVNIEWVSNDSFFILQLTESELVEFQYKMTRQEVFEYRPKGKQVFLINCRNIAMVNIEEL